MAAQIIGAIKVKDGLFIGDEFSAQDLEFIVSNKVTAVVNCASRQIANHWEPIGVSYLSFPWFDHESQIILDISLKKFHTAFQFIQKTLSKQESVLVHSIRGRSRSVCLISAYLIYKFKWPLIKTLQFLHFRRPDIDLNPGFQRQLYTFQDRIFKKSVKVFEWNIQVKDQDEKVLTNTFLNSLVADIEPTQAVEGAVTRIQWIDQKFGLLNDQLHPECRNLVESEFVVAKSCLKGAEKDLKYYPVYREPVKGKVRTGLMFNQTGSLSNTLQSASILAKEISKDLKQKNLRLSAKVRSKERLKKSKTEAPIMRSRGSQLASQSEKKSVRAKRPTSAPQKTKVQNESNKFPVRLLRRNPKQHIKPSYKLN